MARHRLCRGSTHHGDRVVAERTGMGCLPATDSAGRTVPHRFGDICAGLPRLTNGSGGRRARSSATSLVGRRVRSRRCRHCHRIGAARAGGVGVVSAVDTTRRTLAVGVGHAGVAATTGAPGCLRRIADRDFSRCRPPAPTRVVGPEHNRDRSPAMHGPCGRGRPRFGRPVVVTARAFDRPSGPRAHQGGCAGPW